MMTQTESTKMSTTEIYNYIQVNDQTITGGQPTADQLRSAAAEGFITVINLATTHSTPALEDEAGLVRSLGLNYYHIPVEWENPKDSDFAAFEGVMAQIPAGKTSDPLRGQLPGDSILFLVCAEASGMVCCPGGSIPRGDLARQPLSNLGAVHRTDQGGNRARPCRGDPLVGVSFPVPRAVILGVCLFW